MCCAPTASRRFAPLNFLHQCAVGFSGVLFSLLLVDSSLNGAPRR